MKNLVLKSLLLLSFYNLVTTSLARAETLTDESYFFKISMALRGTQPSALEREAFKKVQATAEKDAFLRQKIKDYLTTKQHIEKLTVHLEDLFYLKPTGVRTELFNFSKDSMNYVGFDFENFRTDSLQYSTTSNLFRKMIKDNLSWDALLTGKTYDLPLISGQSPDALFYQQLTQDKSVQMSNIFTMVNDKSKTDSLDFLHLDFKSDDSRLAGAITTPRFYSRFATTGLNKNRRRAAAVFRIFLCDSMAAAIPESHSDGHLKDLIFPLASSASEDQIRGSLDARHGTQSDCMNCHYKLDPLGMTFRSSPLTLHEEPSAGKLIYKKADGNLVNIPVKGIGELGQAITQQPEYVDCQIRKFWAWYIGSDIPLEGSVLQEVTAAFESVGRRTNDFIAYLILRPEFRIRKSQDPQLATVAEVRGLFKRCQSCHEGNSNLQTFVPNLTQWPLNDEQNQGSKYWLDRIAYKLDLEHNGQQRQMPPDDGGFRPTLQELLNIKKWISLGAPDEAGKRMVAP